MIKTGMGHKIMHWETRKEVRSGEFGDIQARVNVEVIFPLSEFADEFIRAVEQALEAMQS